VEKLVKWSTVEALNYMHCGLKYVRFLENWEGGLSEAESPMLLHMGVWQGVAVDSLKFHPSLLCPTLLRPAGEPSLKRPLGGRPAAVFYPFGHPMPNAYALHTLADTGCTLNIIMYFKLN
jgi:hypothetical protein